MLDRKIQQILQNYYKDKTAPVLIIDGASKVGKTYIIRETASKYFKNYIEIDLKTDFNKKRIFKNITSIDKFEIVLTPLFGEKILGNIDDTIVFLDNIDVYPNLITLLKDLKTQNKYRYIASSTSLKLALINTFIPTSYIQEVKIYPLDFEEFLWATKKVENNVIEYLKECFSKKENVTEPLHSIMMGYFKEYLLTGGFPQAVLRFVENLNIIEMRKIQKNIISNYKKMRKFMMK